MVTSDPANVYALPLTGEIEVDPLARPRGAGSVIVTVQGRIVLTAEGRVILFEPFISAASFPVYGLLHHEPVAIKEPVDFAETYPRPRDYYAAQGNATRLFFRGESRDWLSGWNVAHAEAFSAFSYFLSGGYSKPALYPAALLGALRGLDSALSCCPRVFGGRCLVELRKN